MSEGDRHLLGTVDGRLVSAVRGTGTPSRRPERLS